MCVRHLTEGDSGRLTVNEDVTSLYVLIGSARLMGDNHSLTGPERQRRQQQSATVSRPLHTTFVITHCFYTCHTHMYTGHSTMAGHKRFKQESQLRLTDLMQIFGSSN